MSIVFETSSKIILQGSVFADKSGWWRGGGGGASVVVSADLF